MGAGEAPQPRANTLFLELTPANGTTSRPALSLAASFPGKDGVELVRFLTTSPPRVVDPSPDVSERLLRESLEMSNGSLCITLNGSFIDDIHKMGFPIHVSYLYPCSGDLSDSRIICAPEVGLYDDNKMDICNAAYFSVKEK